MKVIIHQPLILHYGCGVGLPHEDDLIDTCKERSVSLLIERTETDVTYTIPEQKITLNEVEMNILFYYVLWMFSYRIEYSGLGGAGCDFSLNMYPDYNKGK